MIPNEIVTRWTEYRFPRVSGDDPGSIGWGIQWKVFSPRERG